MDLACPVPAQLWQEPDREELDSDLRWPLNFDCCSGVDWDANSGLQEFVAAAAIEALWVKTGRRFSVCSDVVYPVCVHMHSTGCDTSCGYRAYHIGKYTDKPIISIDGVFVNGVEVPAEGNWYTRGAQLIPIRGGLLWNTPRQDLNIALSGVGTWYVKVTLGEMPPPLLLIAAADLACQLAKFCIGQPCDVPANAVSVTRDGVTISLETGLRAIPTVKMALEAYSAIGKQRISRLIDPSEWAGSIT